MQNSTFIEFYHKKKNNIASCWTRVQQLTLLLPKVAFCSVIPGSFFSFWSPTHKTHRTPLISPLNAAHCIHKRQKKIHAGRTASQVRPAGKRPRVCAAEPRNSTRPHVLSLSSSAGSGLIQIELTSVQFN